MCEKRCFSYLFSITACWPDFLAQMPLFADVDSISKHGQLSGARTGVRRADLMPQLFPVWRSRRLQPHPERQRPRWALNQPAKIPETTEPGTAGAAMRNGKLRLKLNMSFKERAMTVARGFLQP